MRDFLTGIAIILIVALSTMLVAPYFVDWNGQRGLLERELSRALAQKVTIGGDIDLKLLPTPYLRLNQTVIGSDDGAVRVGIRHLDLELSVAPLLHGEFDIIEGHLDEPTVRVTLQPGRTFPSLPATPALGADVRLERVVVADGTLAIADPQSGRTFIVDHVDASAEAPSLTGPFKGQGTFGSDTGGTHFRFSTTTPSKGTTHLNLTLGETAARPGLAFDGVAQLRPANGEVEASFTGAFAAQGRVPAAATGDAPTPWQLSGTLALDAERAVLTNGQLRIGGEDNGLNLNATGNGDFGEHGSFHLDLAAKELDIDRLAGASLDASNPKPPQLPSLAELRRLAAAVAPPLPTDLSVRIDAATWGNEPLTDLSARFTLGSSLVHDFSVSGQGPGGLHVSADGTTAASGGFDGRFAFGADDVALAARWLKAVAPAVSVSPRDLPFHSASIAGRFVAGRGAQRVDDLALVLDGSRLGGRLRITPATGTGRATVTADLKAKEIDLDSLPTLRSFRRAALPVDLDLNLDVGAVNVAQLGSGSLRTGPAHLDLMAEGGRTMVRSLKVANIDGADVDAVGRIENGTVTLTGTLDAAKLEAVTGLSQQLAPGRIADFVAARAADLAPAHLKIDGAFPLGSSSKGERARLDVTGSLAATSVAVRLAPDPASSGSVIEAEADAQAGSTLLRQIGSPGLPVGSIGASRLALEARGPLDGLLDSTLIAAFGPSQLTMTGRYDLFGTGHGGSGTAHFSSPDAAPLLQALATPGVVAGTPANLSAAVAIGQTGIALTDLAGMVGGTKVGGMLRWQRSSGDEPSVTGALDLDRLSLGGLLGTLLGPEASAAAGDTWSDKPFVAAGATNLPRSAVKVQVDALDLGLGLVAHHAGFELGTGPALLTLQRGSAALADGRLEGDLVLRRDGGQAALEASLSTKAVQLDLPAVRAKLDAKLEFAGSGQSALALVTSLAGSGEAAADEVDVAGLAPTVLPRLFADVQSDALAVDDESVRRAFDGAPASHLPLGRRKFALSLAGGVLGLAPQDRPANLGAIGANLGGSFDLRRKLVDFRLTETLRNLPRNWTGAAPAVTITQAGPPASTVRSIDVSAFVNAMAAGAIARESARIESFEFDLRERAFFNARLAADRRREQDRKAEADARATAEAARRAAAAAAETAPSRLPPPDRPNPTEPPAAADPAR